MYAQADLRLCWSHIPHCWKSHALAHMILVSDLINTGEIRMYAFSLLNDISGSVVVDSLLIVTPIVGSCNCFTFCCVILCVHDNFVIILMGKRELVALLSLAS